MEEHNAKISALYEAANTIETQVTTLSCIFGDNTPVELSERLMSWINAKVRETANVELKTTER